MGSKLVKLLLDIGEFGLKKVNFATLDDYPRFYLPRAFGSLFSHLGREIQSQAIVPVSHGVMMRKRKKKKIKHWRRSLTQSLRIRVSGCLSLGHFHQGGGWLGCKHTGREFGGRTALQGVDDAPIQPPCT